MKQGSKPAVQRRSRQTRDRIVDAMDLLLLDHDFRDINVTELAAEAQVSPGAIYRRFEGGLLPVLFELYRVTLQRRAEAPEADLDLAAAGGLRPALRQFARTVWEQLSGKAHIYRAVYLYARLHSESASAAPANIQAQALGGARQMLEPFHSEIARTDLDHAAAAVTYFFNTIFIERALFADRRPLLPALAEGEGFADEMAEFVFGYLTTPDADAA
jgi:AcrR family transcriptional regulator